MNFPLQNRKGKKKAGKKALVVISVLALILFMANYFSQGALTKMVRVPALALWGANEVVEDTLSAAQNSVTSKETLIKERELLKERVQELELYALNNLVLVSENEELRKLLGGERTQSEDGVLARVISHGGEFPYGTIVIKNEGTKQLPVDSLVFGGQNVALGTLMHSSTNSSLLSLFSASEKETPVLIGTGDRVTQAMLIGAGNGNMIAKIPRDADIQVDDPVVLFAQETALVGFIGDIEMQPTDAFQLVRVRTPLNIGTIRFVRIR